jgi:Tfp pilus assembly protein PilV
VALLEVLMAAIVLGIAVVGVSLLLSNAQMAVVGQGDRYVALYLAQQRIESLTATVLQNLNLLDPNRGFVLVGTGTTTETLQTAGEQAGGGLQQFTRTTCINFVNDDNPSIPAGCTPCSGALSPACTNHTKRITVTVTPFLRNSDPVTLVTVITDHPASN